MPHLWGEQEICNKVIVGTDSIYFLVIVVEWLHFSTVSQQNQIMLCEMDS